MAEQDLTTFDEVSRGSGSLENVPDTETAGYCCADSTSTLALSRKLHGELSTDRELLEVYTGVELPLSAVLTRMEHTGIGLDRNASARRRPDKQRDIQPDGNRRRADGKVH